MNIEEKTDLISPNTYDEKEQSISNLCQRFFLDTQDVSLENDSVVQVLTEI